LFSYHSPGNIDNRKPVPGLMNGLLGKLIADKWNISKKLFNNLFDKKVTLITKIKKKYEKYFIIYRK